MFLQQSYYDINQEIICFFFFLHAITLNTSRYTCHKVNVKINDNVLLEY